LLLLLLLPFAVQVWNINPVVGIVGVFNLQGSSWDRNRRKFHVHDKRGQTLTTNIWPGDVEAFRHSAAAAADGDGDGGSSRWADAAAAAGAAGGTSQQQQQQQQLYAVYRYGTEELAVVPNSGSISVALGPSGSDLVWVSPLRVCGAISFAPIGLVDMFNGGGAVTSCKLAPAHVHAQAAAAAANGGVVSSSRGSSGSPVVAAAAAAGGAAAHGSPSAVAALQLKGCGRVLAYSSVRPSRVLLNLTPHNFAWDEFTNRLEFEVPQLEGLQCEVQVLYQ
jgi:raffinose synthase